MIDLLEESQCHLFVITAPDAVPPPSWAAALAEGKGVAFMHSYEGLAAAAARFWPEADVWYTERNGDPIALLVPRETPKQDLPNAALGYRILEWIHPEGEFGVMPFIQLD
jgi:hypothetical protein